MTVSSWLNFGRPAPTGRGLWWGEIFGYALLLQPARSVCVSLSAFSIILLKQLKSQGLGIKQHTVFTALFEL